MKRIIMLVSLCLTVILALNCIIASGFSLDSSKYVDLLSNEKIVGYLPQILEQADEKTEIDAEVWIIYNETFDRSQYSNDKLAEASYSFHSTRNEEFAKTLPEGAVATKIGSYAPVVSIKATKAQILEIAKMDNVANICEGESYSSMTNEAELLPQNSFFNSTMLVNGKTVSFLDNEYYRAYADFYGKFFVEKLKNEAEGFRIDDLLYKKILLTSGEKYVTLVLKELGTDDYIAKDLNLDKSAVVAVSKSYPVAMVKLTSEIIDDILESSKVLAVYDAFPSATEPEVVNDAILSITYAPSVADARRILRYAAKLDNAPSDISMGKQFFFTCDADLDGEITVADARAALRIAAKLDKGNTYYKSNNGVGQFWVEAYIAAK